MDEELIFRIKMLSRKVVRLSINVTNQDTAVVMVFVRHTTAAFGLKYHPCNKAEC